MTRVAVTVMALKLSRSCRMPTGRAAKRQPFRQEEISLLITTSTKLASRRFEISIGTM